MIITKLQGGLGNQMFQYAAARALSGKTAKVKLDHTFLNTHNSDAEHFTARTYELGIFKNMRTENAKRWQVEFCKNQSTAYALIRSVCTQPATVITQETEYIDFQKINAKHIYLDGYFQSEKYFSCVEDMIKIEFEFPALDQKNLVLANSIQAAENAVSIHIRRGDYLRSEKTHNTHGVLPLTYYHLALDELRSRYPKLTLFIFSDDISWAKKNLISSDDVSIFVEGNCETNSWKDMALMTFCKHHIMANSSFSWWGAWLSDKRGEVFAPQHWFNPEFVDFNVSDFIPERWTLVKHE